MRKEHLSFELAIYDSIGDLDREDADLLKKAREVTGKAYAPYSNFQVGAAALMFNKKIITGTNQENAAYPAGICAERVMLSTASSLFPGEKIEVVAVAYNNLKGMSDRPVSPCGICRQSFTEFQHRTGSTIRLILSGMTGKVHVIEDVSSLLPLVFASKDLD